MPLPPAALGPPHQSAGSAPRFTESISVDFGALSALASNLRSLQREMQQPHGTLCAQLDGDLAAAFDAGEADWTAQRKKLAAFFQSMAAGVEASVAAYRQADSVAAAAAHRGQP